jgi:hypothetical protein
VDIGRISRVTQNLRTFGGERGRVHPISISAVCMVTDRMNTAGVDSNQRPEPHPTYIAQYPTVNTKQKLRTLAEGEGERETETYPQYKLKLVEAEG